VITGVLGPLAWPLAVGALRADRRTVVEATEGDVLVALAPGVAPDGLVEALGQVPGPIRGATLVSVLDAEDADTHAGREAATDAVAALQRCADALTATGHVDGPIDHRVLFGRPADRIARFAETGGYRAIVLGSGGSRPHHLLHGAARARLERLTSIPIVTNENGRQR
jgi:nucleotide-binding universal stress UspA family protein